MYIFGNRVEVIQGDVPVKPIRFLVQDNGVALDLSGKTYNVEAVDSSGATYIDREATVYDASGGEIHVYPQATETDTLGEYRMYVYDTDAPDHHPTGFYVEYAVIAK